MSVEVILSCLVPYARNHVLQRRISERPAQATHAHTHTLSYCSKCQEIQARIERKENADGHTIVKFSYCITKEAHFQGRAPLWRLFKNHNQSHRTGLERWLSGKVLAAGCSCTGPGFISQRPHGGSQPPIALVPRDPMPISGL